MSRIARAPEPTLSDRLTIAAELQDLVAHRVAAISVQASVAIQALAPQCGPQPALDAVSALSREAMSDLRRLSRVLDDGRPATYSPQPALSALAGLDVVLDAGGLCDGDVPAAVALCAYRAVELIAAAAQGRASARPAVVVRVTAKTLEVTLALEGAADPLVAARVRERLRACAGSLTVENGSWRLVLPLDAA